MTANINWERLLLILHIAIEGNFHVLIFIFHDSAMKGGNLIFSHENNRLQKKRNSASFRNNSSDNKFQ